MVLCSEAQMTKDMKIYHYTTPPLQASCVNSTGPGAVLSLWTPIMHSVENDCHTLISNLQL